MKNKHSKQIKKIVSASLTEKMGYPDKACSNSIIHEALNRGYTHYAFRIEDLFEENGIVFANAHQVLRDDAGNLYEPEQVKKLDLSKLDAIHVRINPPFDMKYISALYLLAKVKHKTLVLNNPESILLNTEKFIYPELQKFTPKTLISSSKEQIIEFWKSEGDIILKPLYEFGGRGVFRLKKEEENYKSILTSLLEKHPEPLIAQKYIPEVKQGDKRIFFIGGELIGAFTRIPPKGQIQAAYAQGGGLQKSKLTKVEEKICKIIKPILKQKDIFVCGLDVIGDHITEINITCPAGFTGFEDLYNINAKKIYWDMLEERLKK
jgi:glutathione synthase